MADFKAMLGRYGPGDRVSGEEALGLAARLKHHPDYEEKIGLATYQASLAIADRIAKAAPAGATWPRHLAAAYHKAGDLLAAQGHLPQALATYQASQAIMFRLAEADPANAGRQRDLAVSHAKLADLYRRTAERDKAMAALREGQAIILRLAKLLPGSTLWRKDLAGFAERIVSLGSRPGEKPAAIRTASGAGNCRKAAGKTGMRQTRKP